MNDSKSQLPYNTGWVFAIVGFFLSVIFGYKGCMEIIHNPIYNDHSKPIYYPLIPLVWSPLYFILAIIIGTTIAYFVGKYLILLIIDQPRTPKDNTKLGPNNDKNEIKQPQYNNIPKNYSKTLVTNSIPVYFPSEISISHDDDEKKCYKCGAVDDIIKCENFNLCHHYSCKKLHTVYGTECEECYDRFDNSDD